MQQVNQGLVISYIPAAGQPVPVRTPVPTAVPVPEPAPETVVFSISGTAGPGESIRVTNDEDETVAEGVADANGYFLITQRFAEDDELYPEQGDVLTVTTSGGNSLTFTFGDDTLGSDGALSITEVGTALISAQLAAGIGVTATNFTVDEVAFREGNRWVIEGNLTDDQGNADKGAQVIAFLMKADGSRIEIGSAVVDTFPAPGGFGINVRPPTEESDLVDEVNDTVEIVAISSDGDTTFTVVSVINPEPPAVVHVGSQVVIEELEVVADDRLIVSGFASLDDAAAEGSAVITTADRQLNQVVALEDGLFELLIRPIVGTAGLTQDEVVTVSVLGSGSDTATVDFTEPEPPAGFVEAVVIEPLLATIRNTIASGSVAAAGGSAAIPAEDLHVAVAAAQIAAANGGANAGQVLSTTVGEALGDPTRLFFFHEGQVTHADENGVTIMNLLTIDLSNEKQHIEGTHGAGVKSDARVDAEAAFDAGLITLTELEAVPELIPEEGRELSWAELGRVFAAAGTTYQEQLARQSEDDPDGGRLIGYIIKGTAMLGNDNNIVPATISGLIGPDEPWVEWLIEPRENVLQGVIELDDDNDLSMAGVKLVESTLPGMPVVTQAELEAAVGRTGTIVGHYTPQVPTSTPGTFACREMELDPGAEGEDFLGNVILSYEGPITEILDTTAEVDGVLCTQIRVMNALIHVPNDMAVPGISANRAGGEFTGADFPELGSRVVPVNNLGEETYVDTVGSTFAGLAIRGSGGEIIMTSMRFVEVAENVMGSNVTWDISTDGGPTGDGNATANNILPTNGSPANNQAVLDSVSFNGVAVTGPAEQVISRDIYFNGGFMDVGGEEITISSRPTDTGNMNVNHPSALNVLLLGHYAHPIVGGDGKFHITEGETEYMPAGTNRIIRARGRQDAVSARIDIRGQVKPDIASGNEDDGSAVYNPIPSFVTLELDDLGRYQVPVTPNTGLGGLGAGGADQGGLLRGDLGGGFGDIGTYRFTLLFELGDVAPNIGSDTGDPRVVRVARGITIPAEMTASAIGVDRHVAEIDTRVDLAPVIDVPLDVDFATGLLNDALQAEDQARIALELANSSLTNAQQAVVDADALGVGLELALQTLNSARGAQTAAQATFDAAVAETEAAREDLAGALAAEAGIPELPEAEEAAAEAAEEAAEVAVETAAENTEAAAEAAVVTAEANLANAELGGNAVDIANAELAVADAEVAAATVAQANAQAAFVAARRARNDARSFAVVIAPAGGTPAAEAQAEADEAQEEFVAARQERNAANRELTAAQEAADAAGAVVEATPAAVLAEANAAAAEQAAAEAEAALAAAELGGDPVAIANAEANAADAELDAAAAALEAAQAELTVANASGDAAAIIEANAAVTEAQAEVDAAGPEAASAAAAAEATPEAAAAEANAAAAEQAAAQAEAALAAAELGGDAVAIANAESAAANAELEAANAALAAAESELDLATASGDAAAINEANAAVTEAQAEVDAAGPEAAVAQAVAESTPAAAAAEANAAAAEQVVSDAEAALAQVELNGDDEAIEAAEANVAVAELVAANAALEAAQQELAIAVLVGEQDEIDAAEAEVDAAEAEVDALTPDLSDARRALEAAQLLLAAAERDGDSEAIALAQEEIDIRAAEVVMALAKISGDAEAVAAAQLNLAQVHVTVSQASLNRASEQNDQFKAMRALLRVGAAKIQLNNLTPATVSDEVAAAQAKVDAAQQSLVAAESALAELLNHGSVDEIAVAEFNLAKCRVDVAQTTLVVCAATGDQGIAMDAVNRLNLAQINANAAQAKIEGVTVDKSADTIAGSDGEASLHSLMRLVLVA